MKKLLIMIILSILISITGCSNVDKNDQNNIETETVILKENNQESIIIDIEDDIIEYPVIRYSFIDIECILQNPELPTGCEVTSLAIVLQYYGFNIDKCELSDKYLPQGEIGTVTAYDAFIGNPRYDWCFGCYNSVIVETAEKILLDYDSKNEYIVEDISGTEFENLYDYIDKNIPIIIWATIDMKESYYTKTWNINGKDFTWKAPLHCMVLTGYDISDNLVYVADPLVGNTVYELDTFKQRYIEMYSQAVIIYKQ